MKRDLPIYDIVLNDEDLKQGVGRISLVDDPAIGVDWIKLRSQDTMEIEFSVTLTDNGLCFGCPPNGDGTKKDGSPDARCKGDSADKSGGGRGSSRGAKPSGVSSSISKSIDDLEKAETVFQTKGKEYKSLDDLKKENPGAVYTREKSVPFSDKQKEELTKMISDKFPERTVEKKTAFDPIKRAEYKVTPEGLIIRNAVSYDGVRWQSDNDDKGGWNIARMSDGKLKSEYNRGKWSGDKMLDDLKEIIN